MTSLNFYLPTYRRTEKRIREYESFYKLRDSLPNPSLSQLEETYSELGIKYPYSEEYKQWTPKTFGIGSTMKRPFDGVRTKDQIKSYY